MNLSEIKDKPISELVDIASELGLEDLGRLKKQEIIVLSLSLSLSLAAELPRSDAVRGDGDRDLVSSVRGNVPDSRAEKRGEPVGPISEACEEPGRVPEPRKCRFA